MMKSKRLMAMLLAATMLVGVSTAAFAEEPAAETVVVTEAPAAPAAEPAPEPEPAPAPASEPAPAPAAETEPAPVAETEPAAEVAEQPAAEAVEQPAPEVTEESAPVEGETIVENETVVEGETIVENETAVEGETVVEDETAVEGETIAEDETTAEDETAVEGEIPAEGEIIEVPEAVTLNVTVGVAWDDEGDKNGLRPGSVNVTLNGSDGSVHSAQLSSETAWTYTFTDIPDCAYSLEASCPENYSMSIDQESLTIYNTLRETTETEEATETEENTESEETAETEETTEAPAIAYQRDEAGNLVLDESGNPVAILSEGTTETPVQFQRDENGALVLDENGNPIPTAMVPVTAQKVQTLEDMLNPNRSIDVYASWEGDKLYCGDDMTLNAVLEGYDNAEYTLQWQVSADASTWTDISGATGSSMTVKVTEENYLNYWRVQVIITDATAIDA